jgi:hypothetical protein
LQLWRFDSDLKLEKFPELNSHNTLKYLTNNSEGAGILVTLSEAGITYVKEVLVNQILTEITPLSLPDIHSQVACPIGRVDTAITHIELSGANFSHSDVDLGKTGITVIAEDIKTKIHLHWEYKYASSYIPLPISDAGWADIEVSFWPLPVSLIELYLWLSFVPCLSLQARRPNCAVAFSQIILIDGG